MAWLGVLCCSKIPAVYIAMGSWSLNAWYFLTLEIFGFLNFDEEIFDDILSLYIFNIARYPGKLCHFNYHIVLCFLLKFARISCWNDNEICISNSCSVCQGHWERQTKDGQLPLLRFTTCSTVHSIPSEICVWLPRIVIIESRRLSCPQTVSICSRARASRYPQVTTVWEHLLLICCLLTCTF